MTYPRYFVFVYGSDTARVTAAIQALDPLVVKHPTFRDEIRAAQMKKLPLSATGPILRTSALRIVCRVPDELLILKLSADDTFRIIVEEYKEE
jgi:hypothetical protein